MAENTLPDDPGGSGTGDPTGGSGELAASLATTHRQLRTELTALLRARGPEVVADLPVPACPEWTVHETVSHLVGVGTDIVAGNLEGVATDAWTEAQVAARRGRDLAEVLDEWDAVDPGVEDLSPAFGEVQAQWCMDCLTHVADIRQALGEPLEVPGGEAMAAMVRFTAGGYAFYGRQAGVPLVELVAEGVAVLDGEGIGPARVELAAFELLRGLTGRRSRDQLRAWPWRWADGAQARQGSDPVEPWLVGFDWGPFRVRPTPLDL